MKKLLLKFSSLFFKLHVFFNKQARKRFSPKPYILKNVPSKSNLKIIHINGNFIVGGSTQLIVDIIERTSDHYLHKIVVPAYPEPLPYQPVSIWKFPIGHMAELYKYLKEEEPAIVHIHYWVRDEDKYQEFTLWYETVFAICEELKIKVIQNINVPTKPFKSSAVIHNVFVSNYVMQSFNDSGVNASVIYPGSDFSHFKNGKENIIPVNAIGMVYRLDTDKLNPEAIEVFISAVRKKPDLQCYIIGGGFYYKYYKERVKKEQMEKNFVFTGVVSYKLLPEYYKKISVFVAPVHNESFGQVSPFAMSMGLSVAGYNIGALGEILGYNETLVEYGSIEELASVIIALVNDPEKRNKLGHLNKERAHKYFSIEGMIEQYEKLYKSYL